MNLREILSAGQLIPKKNLLKESKMTNDFSIRHSAALISAIDLMIQTKAIKPGIGKTLQAIAVFWNPEGRIYPSQSKLAAMTGNHRRTIVTHIDKLIKLGIIQTRPQPSRNIQGKQVASSLIYSFNSTKLGQLFKQARDVLQKAAIKLAKQKAKQNDHTRRIEKDHTIKANAYEKKITVTAKLCDWFKSLCQTAIQHEASHLENVIRKKAYDAAIQRNLIKAGKVFSPSEIKKRAEQAERDKPEREQAAKAHQKMVELTKRLRESKFIPDRFTKEMGVELLQLTSNGLTLDVVSRLMLKDFECA